MYETKTNEVFITLAETMEKYQVCRSTIYNMVKKGKLKQWKLKNQTYFKLTDVEKTFDIQEVL